MPDHDAARAALPPEYLSFLDLYRDGRHWDAHEVLEDLWRATHEQERRLFYQGVIQLAAAFVHAERDNMRGVRGLLAKADDKLRRVRSPYLGLDLRQLRGSIAAAAEHAALVAAGDTAFDWRLKPTLQLTERLASCRARGR